MNVLFRFRINFLFVSLGYIVLLENFSLIAITGEGLQNLTYARHSIEHWSSEVGFFSMPNLLWHEASVYNGHLRGPVTFTPIAERLAVEL